MARVTIADCAKRIPNQFTLIEVAAKRARQLAAGQEAMLEWEGDKPTVVALREIAEGLVDETILIDKKAEEEPIEDLFASAEPDEAIVAESNDEPVAEATVDTNIQTESNGN